MTTTLIAAAVTVAGISAALTGCATAPTAAVDAIRVLPAASIAAVAANTDPSWDQKLAIGRILSASKSSPDHGDNSQPGSMFSQLADPVFGQFSASDTPWLGSVFSAAALPATAGTSGLTTVVAFSTSNMPATSAWLESRRRATGGDMTWKEQTSGTTEFVVAANTSDSGVLSGQTLGADPAALAGLSSAAPAVTYANLASAADVPNYLGSAGVLQFLSEIGLLGSGSSGVLVANIDAVDGMWVASGFGRGVKLSGADVSSGNKDLSIIGSVPRSSQVAVAVAGLNDQMATTTGSSDQAKTIATAVGLAWPAATTEVFGQRTVIAFGRSGSDTVGGWRAYDTGRAGPESASKLVDGYLRPNAALGWSVVPTGTGQAVASSAGWASALANPVGGQTLEQSDAFTGMLDGSSDAAVVAAVDGTALAAGSDSQWWSTVSAVTMVMSATDAKAGNVTFTVRARPT